MAVTVDEIIEKPFLERLHEDKLRILSRYKPRPNLHLKYLDENGVLQKAKFEKKMYNDIFWLTGCDKRQKMYCWPCLLYNSSGVWNSGIDDLKFVTEHHKEHAQERGHLEAVFRLHSFIMDNFEESERIYALGRGEMVISVHERPVLCSIIETICSAIIMNNSNIKKLKCDMLEMKECVDILNLQRYQYCDPDTAINFVTGTPIIINDIVDAISMVLKGIIKNEIEESLFASIILTEHSICKEKSQISTILRYVIDGEVYERFIGFTNSLKRRRRVKVVSRHIEKVKKKFNLQDKILAIAVDGAVLQSPHISKLSDPNASLCKYLVPSYFHEFGRVLMQSVSHIENCGLFFKTIKAIQSYFRNEAHFLKLENAMLEKLPNLRKNKWYATSPFIRFLGIYRKYFHDYFTNELAYSTFITGDDRVQITAFKSFLEDLKTIFLLKTFAKIFADYFNKKMDFAISFFDPNFDSELRKFRAKIAKFQKSAFAKLWIDTNMDKIGEKHPDAMKIAELESNPGRKTYSALFGKILNQIIREIDDRRSDTLRLAFCRILNCDSDGGHEFRKSHVSQLLYELAPHLDENTVKSEIAVFTMNNDITSLFRNKEIHGVMKTFNEYDLVEPLSQLYKAAEFILTLPFLPPLKNMRLEKSKIKKIEALSYVPLENGTPSGDTSILRVEKLMLQDRQGSARFYEDVIKKYCEMQMSR